MPDFFVIPLPMVPYTCNSSPRPPQSLFKHTALAKFLSYVVEADVWLGEHYDLFGCRLRDIRNFCHHFEILSPCNLLWPCIISQYALPAKWWIILNGILLIIICAVQSCKLVVEIRNKSRYFQGKLALTLHNACSIDRPLLQALQGSWQDQPII